MALLLIFESPRCFLPNFESIGLSVQEKKRKIYFQMVVKTWWRPTLVSDQNNFNYFLFYSFTKILPTKCLVSWPRGEGNLFDVYFKTNWPSNAYYPRTPDYTLCSGVHVCWSEHSDSSFVYGFMILDYGFGTMTATTRYTLRDKPTWMFLVSRHQESTTFLRISWILERFLLGGCLICWLTVKRSREIK